MLNGKQFQSSTVFFVLFNKFCQRSSMQFEFACNLQVFPSCRYDNGTGEFTVPSGGAGLYYFFVHILCDNDEQVRVDLRRMEELFAQHMLELTMRVLKTKHTAHHVVLLSLLMKVRLQAIIKL